MKILARILIGCVALLVLVLLIGAFSSSKKPAGVVGITAPNSVATTSSDGLKGFADGTYQVGTDLYAGRYKTTGDEDGMGCYWARLKNDSGDFNAIIANDFQRGPGSITVKKTDKFIRFSGGCTWRPV